MILCKKNKQTFSYYAICRKPTVCGRVIQYMAVVLTKYDSITVLSYRYLPIGYRVLISMGICVGSCP